MIVEQTIEIYQINRHRLNNTNLRINAKTEIHRGTCRDADNTILKPGLHRKVFSSYKPVLVLHDLAILLLSFCLSLFAAGPGLQHQKWGILVLMSVMSLSVFVFIFSVFNLYSYGANFIWNHHFARLKKALAWVLISFGLFVLLLHWDNLYSDKIIIPLLTAALVILFIVFKNRRSILDEFNICSGHMPFEHRDYRVGSSRRLVDTENV